MDVSDNSSIHDVPLQVSNSSGFPVWSIIFEIAYMVLVMCVGVPGNLLSIAVQMKTTMKSSTDYYILTMAIFDFVCSALNAPMFVVRNVETLRTALTSTTFCMIHNLLTFMTNTSSSLLLAAVAINRYFLTCHPVSNINLKLNARAKSISIVISVFSIGLCSWSILYEKYDKRSGACRTVQTFMSLVLKSIVMMVFIVMFLITFVCYTKIVLTIRNNHKLMKLRRLGGSTGILAIENKTTRSKSGKVQIKSRWILPFYWRNKVAPQSGDTRQSGTTSKKVSYSPETTQENSSALRTASNKHSGKDDAKKDSSFEENGKTTQSSDTRDSKSVDTNYSALTSIQKDQRVVNKITFMLFLITVVYIITWLMHWSHAFIEDVKRDTLRGVLRAWKYMFMINCAINPVVYSLMSTKYRTKVKSLFKTRVACCT